MNLTNTATDNTAQFFPTLRKKIDEYFKQNNIKPTGNSRLYVKTSILLATFVTLYLCLVFANIPQTWINVVLCIIMGVNFSAIGFNIMHDGAHGSYSKNKYVNECMAYALNLMGGSSFLWKQKHNVSHHSFTNIEGQDDDIDVAPFMRLHLYQKRYWIHRIQHIYGLLLYGFTYLTWIFYNDYAKYFSGKIGDKSILSKMKIDEHIVFWFSKVFYVTVFIILPAFKLGIGTTLIGYLITAFTTGVVIAVVFQLAHVVEPTATSFTTKEAIIAQPIKTDWAIQQIESTANFGTNSKWLSWLLGGLNFQVEHHLFPRISHVHYPKISKIVKETCAEFNVQYKEFPSMMAAVISHLKYLRQIGVA